MFRRATIGLVIITTSLTIGAMVRATPVSEVGEDRAPALGTTALPPNTNDGAILYDRYCAACHGVVGDGKGPGAPLLWPQPRDFTTGNYKWRTTSSGRPPTDEDLRRTIRFGVPGTSMHAFADSLTSAQIDVLLQVLKEFAPRKFRRAATPATRTDAPPADIERGKLLFDTLGCVKCHGTNAKGDGPSSFDLVDDHGFQAAPYDLRTIAMRRPHAPGDNRTEQIYLSLLTGLSGTPMPAYEGAAPEADLWAVASYVESFLSPEIPQGLNNSSTIDKLAIALDKKNRTMQGGFYPGHGSDDERALFGSAIMPQGTPGPQLTPAQSSLDAKQCARCHNKQYREWGGSLHAGAASPGLMAELLAKKRTGAFGALQSCQRCHNPLAEQSPVLSAAQRNATPNSETSTALGANYTTNPDFSPDLRKQGLNCASCHVRKRQKYGPPESTSKRIALPGYPLTKLALYERSDFCLPCHQLSSRSATLDQKPLLNTYKEWLEGPYMRRGVQCQHCHMPDREHTWKGIHDPETFRQGIEVTTITGRGKSGTVSVRVRVKNVGAGHYLPTTPTPAAWVSIQLVDASRKPIDGAYSEKRIGRHLVYKRGWKQLEDTRIPPGESLELASAWKKGRVSKATHARIEVRVEPDEYYERTYINRLKSKNRTPRERELLQQALIRSRKSQYSAQVEWVEIRELDSANQR